MNPYVFKCQVCNHEYEGGAELDKCPQCNRPALKKNTNWTEEITPNNGGKNYRLKYLSHPEGVKEYVATLADKALRAMGVKDALLINEWQTDAHKLSIDDFAEKARQFAVSNPGFDALPILEYSAATKAEVLSDEAIHKSKASNELVNAILPKLNESKGKMLLRMSIKHNYSQVKNAIRYALSEHINVNQNESPEEFIVPFIISKETIVQGQVLSALGVSKKSIPLVTVFNGKEIYYQFFGEPRPVETKKMAPYVQFNDLFFAYRFISEGMEEMFLLSHEELELANCEIEGMVAECHDAIKLGEMARINTTTKVMFVASQKQDIGMPNEMEFWANVNARFSTHEDIHRAFFGAYPHPKWFSEFLISWIFSGKLDKMPTHIGILSPPSSGKSHIIEGLASVFREKIGEGGTITGLVPNFGDGVPKEGYLIRCRRFAFIDEFIHIIARSKHSGAFDGGSALLLKVLEHSTGEFSSGYGTLRAKPRMWAMFASNIRSHEHIQNMVDLHSKLNAAFLSRVLWYVYDEEHMREVNARKQEAMIFSLSEQETAPRFEPEKVELVDYLHAFTMKNLDVKKLNAIHERWRSFVPADLQQDIYDSRMIMHLYRIMDGYVKYKSITGRGAFEVHDTDYDEVSEIFGRIVKSWSYGVGIDKLPSRMKLGYLSTDQRKIFETVDGMQGIDDLQLETVYGMTVQYPLKDLIRNGLLKTVDGLNGVKSYYTFDFKI